MVARAFRYPTLKRCPQMFSARWAPQPPGQRGPHLVVNCCLFWDRARLGGSGGGDWCSVVQMCASGGFFWAPLIRLPHSGKGQMITKVVRTSHVWLGTVLKHFDSHEPFDRPSSSIVWA